mmetsp:Transcript_1267/g.3675  ORF Transcript_1267/g.3675 Transcript_1267/m.3675 type:complete len:246 (-) Transcript_1267:181-918(-)
MAVAPGNSPRAATPARTAAATKPAAVAACAALTLPTSATHALGSTSSMSASARKADWRTEGAAPSELSMMMPPVRQFRAASAASERRWSRAASPSTSSIRSALSGSSSSPATQGSTTSPAMLWNCSRLKRASKMGSNAAYEGPKWRTSSCAAMSSGCDPVPASTATCTPAAAAASTSSCTPVRSCTSPASSMATKALRLDACSLAQNSARASLSSPAAAGQPLARNMARATLSNEPSWGMRRHDW